MAKLLGRAGAAPMPPRQTRKIWKTTLALALVLLAILPAALAWPDQAARLLLQQYRQTKLRHFPGTPDLTPEKAMDLAKAGKVIFLDVRQPTEQAVSTLPGAFNLARLLREKPDLSGKTLVVYCTTGYRSGYATNRLALHRLPAANLAGGILAWINSGGKLSGPDGRPSKKVHTYGPPPPGVMPPGWQAVW